MRVRRAPAKTEAGELRQAPAWQSFKLSHRGVGRRGALTSWRHQHKQLPSLSTHNSPVIILIIRTIPRGGTEGSMRRSAKNRNAALRNDSAVASTSQTGRPAVSVKAQVVHILGLASPIVSCISAIVALKPKQTLQK